MCKACENDKELVVAVKLVDWMLGTDVKNEPLRLELELSGTDGFLESVWWWLVERV